MSPTPSFNALRIWAVCTSLFPGCYSPNDPVLAEGDGSEGPAAPGTTSGGTSSGDGSLSTSSASDDHPSTTSSTTTTEPVCGDGVTEGDEACDDGLNDGSYGGCTPDCSELGPYCGDNTVQGPESCDDGDTENGDGCNLDCTVSGEVVWTRTVDTSQPRSVEVDAENNLLVAFLSSGFYSYDSEGDPRWSVDFDLPGASTTYGSESVRDPNLGSWMIGGSAAVTGQASNVWWRRLDDAGIIGSGGTYDNPSHTIDESAGIAFDGSGNYYIAGSAADPMVAGDYDVWLRKYNPDGRNLWLRTFDGGADDRVRGVATSPDDDVILAGYTEVAGQSLNAWIRKYDAEGEETWTRTAGGEEPSADRAYAIAAGDDGSIAVVGEQSSDVWVRTYSPGGVAMWTHTFDGPASESEIGDYATSVAIDSTGAIVVAATIVSGPSDTDAWLRKLAPDGDVLWTASPEADEVTDQVASAVAVDSNDYIVVVGTTGNSGGWIKKYTP